MSYLFWNRFTVPFASLIAVMCCSHLGTAFAHSDTRVNSTSEHELTAVVDWLEKQLDEVTSLEALSNLANEERARQSLSKSEAEQAIKSLQARYRELLLKEREKERDAKEIVLGEHKLKYEFRVFGEKPANGHCLVISMHGGGGAPKRVNDGQWENQKRLYKLKEAIYVAPRAPTDTWNLWQAPHIDALFTRLIGNMIAFEGVDPNRIYITGYSAGGDGTYQLAPRMADQFAAAAMMAGHPGDAKADGLRNLPFTLHVGAKDAAYKRNQKAVQWKEMLQTLKRGDPNGYEHWVKIHQGKGHWMNHEDRAGVEWMLKFTRNLEPERVVWIQDNVKHDRFYWLSVSTPKMRDRLVVSRVGNDFTVEQADMPEFSLLLRDSMLELDQPLKVFYQGELVRNGIATRTLKTIIETLCDRGDPEAIFSSRFPVTLPE